MFSNFGACGAIPVPRSDDIVRGTFDRVLKADEVSPSIKSRLRDECRELDPVSLVAEIARLQDELWPLAYRELPSRHVDPDREAAERAR
jgi:hypothetical protein